MQILKMSEASLEKKCKKHYDRQWRSGKHVIRNKKGKLVALPRSRKMNGLGFRGWPDRLFPLKKRRVWWVEFKKPGHKDDVTTLQAAIHRMLRATEQDVSVIDSYEEFVRELERRI